VRTLLVGDVHGCAAALEGLVHLARPDRIVLLGDLFTKGPDPLGVWERVAAWQPECVLGNHDARMLRVWEDPGPGKAQAVCRQLPEVARVWLAALPLMIRGEAAGRAWTAVHAGLHPDLGEAGTTAPESYLLRRWPDDSDLGHPYWWQAYRGPSRVFYGHDAMRGLQVRPRTVGLDTGCVYGNALSGYVLEEEQVVQVLPDGRPAPRVERYWLDFSEADDAGTNGPS
jgi:serine/threonine protein phosphatase 1